MKRILIIFTFFLLLSPAYLFSQEWNSIKTDKYSIDYPSDWEINEEGAMGTAFILFSPLKDGNSFRENINLMIQDLTGFDFDLDSYTELSESQVGQYIQNAKILKSERLQGAAGEYHMIEYTGTQQEFNLHWKQYYWYINDKAYLLTFTAEDTAYEEYISLANQIMNSFKLN